MTELVPKKIKGPKTPDDGPRGKKQTDTTSAALLCPEVLEIVFKHLDLTRLKLLRTVSKIWNEEISRGMRKNGSASYIHDKWDCGTLMGIMKRSRELQLPQTLQELVLRVKNNQMLDPILSAPLELLVTKLVMEKMDFRNPGWTGRLYALLLNCSSTLTALEIRVCRLEFPETFRTTGWVLEFPLLEELTLTEDASHYRDRSTSRTDQALFLFSNLIKSAPKLSSLQINLGVNLEHCLQRLIDLDRFQQIKKLNITEDFEMQGARDAFMFHNLTSFTLNADAKVFVDNSYVQELLRQNSETLKRLSLRTFAAPLPRCPNLERFAVNRFSWKNYLDVTGFPTLNSVEIINLGSPLPAPATSACPASVKRVKICWGEEPSTFRGSLRSICRFFASSATTWELPYEYLVDFSAFIGAEKRGKGITSLTITFEPDGAIAKYNLKPLIQGMGKLSKLRDLQELTLRNCGMELDSQIWGSFKPNLLPRLHTLTFFKHTDLAKLKEALDIMQLRKVVLLHNKPVRFDRDAEEFFSKFLNVTSRYEDSSLRELPREMAI